jgi:hypothetical protein
VLPPPDPDSVNGNDCDDDRLPGCSSFFTVMEPVVATFLVLVIVHDPLDIFAEHVPAGDPLPVYPATGVSVAVHVLLVLLTPLTVKFAGSASDAVVSSLATLPCSQLRLTVTFAELWSEKLLETKKVTVVVVGASAMPICCCGAGGAVVVGCVVDGSVVGVVVVGSVGGVDDAVVVVVSSCCTSGLASLPESAIAAPDEIRAASRQIAASAEPTRISQRLGLCTLSTPRCGSPEGRRYH